MYQPWTNVAKIHHKTSDPKIFISHIPLLNFAGAALHIPPRMCANPSWTNVPRHTTYKLQSENFHLTHPCFELCRNNPKQTTPRMCANPEPTFQRYTTKPQTLRCVISHICFELCRNSSPCYTTHVSQPILNQRPKTHYLQTLDPKIFISTHPCFELCRKRLHLACVANPEPTVAKIHHKTSDPKIFISHIPVLNFAGTTRNMMTPRMCANRSWTNVPKTHHKTSDPKMFISHIPVLNFAGTALHVTPHMWANPSWTNVPRHTTNFRSENFHLTHPCFELCRNSSPCYTTHVSQPILYQRPKIHHKRLMSQFCKPILIPTPKIHLSKFQCSPYRRKKCWALQ